MTTHRSNMDMVQALARKYSIRGRIEKSNRGDKKLMITLPDGDVIHFGHPLYEDYTINKDLDRRNRYWKRSRAIRDKEGRLTGDDPRSANFYSMRLLWDVEPGLKP